MSDLIKRADAIEAVNSYIAEYIPYLHGVVEYIPLDLAKTLKDVPSADAVEVVRCKDCRYWQEYQEGHYPNESCPWDKGETPDEDDYCSFGERREP